MYILAALYIIIVAVVTIYGIELSLVWIINITDDKEPKL